MKTYNLSLHCMWYESMMLSDTFDSILSAAQNMSKDSMLNINICLNYQTYIETPINKIDNCFNYLIQNHPIFRQTNSNVITSFDMKTEDHLFYNIADMRRDYYKDDITYNIWGESDTLLPEQFFYILDNIYIDQPHVLSLSSRKMWDDSWKMVEHIDIQNLNRPALGILDHEYVITQDELNDFNSKYAPEIVQLPYCKIDGSLLCLSSNLPQFIPDDMHFAREDTCTAYALSYNKIPQYHVSNIIKGHNYSHPLKRTNTNTARNSDIWKQYEQESTLAMMNFINKF